MSSSCMGKVLPKEKQFGVKVCRERKCEDLVRDPQYPESPQYCAVTHGMPGSMPMCVKEMDDEHFIRQISGQLNTSPYNTGNPGVRNCPAECPYKILFDGTKFKPGKGNIPAKIGKCALTGKILGEFGACPCNVIGNEDQANYIKRVLVPTIRVFQEMTPDEILRTCHLRPCPDGLGRCKGGTDCPIIRMPFKDLTECPLWRIPAKLLPAPVEPAIEAPKKSTPEPEENTKKKPVPAEKKTRKKKEPEDPICEACRERFKGPVPEHACAWCKEEQEKHGRRAWTSKLNLQVLHLGDMNVLGQQIPNDSVDVIFTDPVYLKDVYEDAYAQLAELACRVLKPHGFLFTYAPQTHLDEIMDLLRYSTNIASRKQILHYFWVIESLNGGRSTAKNHQRNAICLHKPILVFQKAESREEMKGAHRCFADVVRGLRQKKFHPWQQSVHDVLGIISRFMVPGEILLDPYAGTGTSLIAANLLGMDWIGFEIDPKTHAIAVRELQQRPITLFSFDEPEDPTAEARPVEITSACLDCEALDKCIRKDPYAGCLDAVNAIEDAAKPDESPQPFVQHSCGTCGHHKGRKTFHETCPRLGELLFKGGTKSAKVLMEETQRENCEGWISKAERVPNVTWCSTIRNCPSLDWEGGICTKTGKKLTDQTYCPTQHQIGEKPEEPKKPASRKPKKECEA